MSGNTLIEELVKSIGLPQELVRKRLDRLAQEHQLNLESATIEDLRLILADLVQEVLLEVKAELTSQGL